MRQRETIRRVTLAVRLVFGSQNVRTIKIHGGTYQEQGLPDLMLLVRGGPCFWLEAKQTWQQRPTALQQHNVESLREFGFITGYVVGDEFKADLGDQPQKILDFLRSLGS